MQKHDPTRQPFEGLALETIEKLSAFVLCARHKAFKSSNEAALFAQYDLAIWCEHINAHLAFAIDVIVCPKGDSKPTVEATHQLAERWILSYEPSGAKPDSERPLPKLDALSFLIRSLGGYAGSMPLHTLLKDPVRFTFLYGAPSPSCCSLKELTFHERPSVFLFAPLKTPSGTFTFSVKFIKTLSLSEENEYNIIIQPSCSGTTYTCTHGISPPSTPVSIVPRTEIRHASPPVNIPKKRPQQQQQKTEEHSSPYGSPFAFNFLTAAASQPTTSTSDGKKDADPSALPEAPQGIQRPLSYSSKKAFSCSPLYSSPPPIRRSAITHDRPGATKLRDSGRARGKEDTDSDDDEEDRLSVSPLRKSFTKGSEKEFLAALPSTRLGPSPSDLLGPFVGSFEESILNGRMCDTPSTLFEGFSYDIAVSGKNYASKHIRKDFVAIFYHVQQDTPYVGTLDLQCKNKLGMRIPIKGVLQATIFNPTRTPIKTFLAKYDLTDMPPGTKTFIRQKMVTPGPPSILRYALHLRFACTAKKKFYLRNDVRVLFPHRMPDDMDGLKIIYDCPDNPKYFPD